MLAQSAAVSHRKSLFRDRSECDNLAVNRPAVSLVLEWLKQIRDSRDEAPRISRSTLARICEMHSAPSRALTHDKHAALAAINARVSVCTKCPHLARSRTQTVFGVGNPDAELMFIGEAPGADEDLRGEPFVGCAGQLLTRIIETMGLTRADIYIANILKCRPDMPERIAGNRPPTPAEMQTCIGYLIEQIGIIEPKVIVALGATAVEGLLGARGVMRELRGTWRSFHDTPLMITYHPSYLLRNQSPGEKRKVWEDMLAVMEKLERPISEKQRSYFL